MAANRQDHPWFPGARGLVYLLIYQSKRTKKGEERWVLRSSRVVPTEILDEVALKERYGAGYFKVEGRQDGSKIAGNPKYVSIPDDADGAIPIPSIDDGTGSDDEVVGSGVEKMIFEFMKFQLKRADDEHARNLKAQSDLFDGVVKALTATRNAGGSDESYFAKEVRSLRESYEKLREDNTKLLITKVKLEHDAEDDGIGKIVAKESVPRILNILERGLERAERKPSSAPAGRAPTAGIPAEVKAATAHKVPEKAAPATDGEALKGEVVDLPDQEITASLSALGWTLPPIEEVREAAKGVAEGKDTFNAKQLELFRRLARHNLLPRAHREVMAPFLK